MLRKHFPEWIFIPWVERTLEVLAAIALTWAWVAYGMGG